MASQGYRSIEVHVVNNTQADLSVQSAAALSGWFIAGESAQTGAPLPQYADALWGVATDDPTLSAAADVSLVGLGSYPISIRFQNLPNGSSSATVGGNNVIQGTTQEINTGEMNHSAWQVILTPVPPPFPTGS
jgi:hypothetical protein